MAENVLRWSGLFLIVGAALLGIAIMIIASKPVINQQISPGVSFVMLLSSILLLISLPAMYARQVNASGWPGLIGYGLLQTGLLLMVVIAATPLLYPTLKTAPGENLVIFLLGIALTFGLLLTGIATLLSGVFPRWTGILIVAATAGFFFVFFVAEFLPSQAGQMGSAFFGILLAIALAWIGIILWMGKFGTNI